MPIVINTTAVAGGQAVGAGRYGVFNGDNDNLTIRVDGNEVTIGSGECAIVQVNRILDVPEGSVISIYPINGTIDIKDMKHGKLVDSQTIGTGAGANPTAFSVASNGSRLLSLYGTMTFGIGVANRFIEIFVNNGSTDVWVARAGGVFVASEVVTVVATPTGQGSVVGTLTARSCVMPLPPFMIPAGWTVGIRAINIQGADQWSTIQYFAEVL